jgi:hypothetical protein
MELPIRFIKTIADPEYFCLLAVTSFYKSGGAGGETRQGLKASTHFISGYLHTFLMYSEALLYEFNKALFQSMHAFFLSLSL